MIGERRRAGLAAWRLIAVAAAALAILAVSLPHGGSTPHRHASAAPSPSVPAALGVISRGPKADRDGIGADAHEPGDDR